MKQKQITNIKNIIDKNLYIYRYKNKYINKKHTKIEV